LLVAIVKSEKKMLEITINEREFHSIVLLRVALSEENNQLRDTAIRHLRHEIVATNITLLSKECGPDWPDEPENADLVRWIAATSAERQEASHAVEEVMVRYGSKNERKLNVAEHIGKCIVETINSEKFEGVQTSNGILAQVADEAREADVVGARDKDTLRKLWKSYRGVAHLGMAIDYCEDNPRVRPDVLRVADKVRLLLSENCPKGTSKPYVDPNEQIKFIYLSMLSGPRFRNRGLPFYVS
jgi:hypothetical protein